MFLTSLRLLVCLLFVITPITGTSTELVAPSGTNTSDLSIGVIRVERTSNDTRLDISVTVSNDGSELHDDGTVTLNYLTGTELQSATLLETVSLPLLFPTSDVQLSASFNRSDVHGNLYAIVDPLDLISEADEQNNKSVLILRDTPNIPTDTLNLILDDNNVLLGEIVRVGVIFRRFSSDQALLFAKLSVENTRGTEVFSAEKSMLQITSEDTVETELLWFTESLRIGQYTLFVSIVDAEDNVISSKQQLIFLENFNTNRPPVAEPDVAFTEINQTVVIDLGVNDFEPDGNRLLYYLTEFPLYGEISELRGLVTYTPDAGFVGVDQFSYQLDDSLGSSDWADVTVNVLPPEQGCTWIRDLDVHNKNQDIAKRGWAEFPLPDDGSARYASLVQSNDNSDLFEEQPYISFPSCSLYFKPRTGVVGAATVSYVVLDIDTGGENYLSETRTFKINVLADNLPLEVISIPITEVQIGNGYTYTPVLAVDESFQVVALKAPKFLTVNGDTLEGFPEAEDIGVYKVSLRVNVGDREEVQHYFLSVTPELESTSQVLDDEAASQDSARATEFGGFGSGPLNPWALLIGLLFLHRSRVKVA